MSFDFEISRVDCICLSLSEPVSEYTKYVTANSSPQNRILVDLSSVGLKKL